MIFLICSLMLTTLARADFIIAPGLSFTTAHESKKVEYGGGYGLGLELEYVLAKPFTIVFGGAWRKNEALAEYSHQSVAVDDLSADATTLVGLIGPRMRIIDFTYFKVFLGAGVTAGTLNLAYDRNEFVSETGSSTGFTSSEKKSFFGYYLEGGTDFILTNESALRLVVRRTTYRTGEFETLNNDPVTIAQTQVGLQYMMYVKW
jgi:opacity protein-like surface antigen